MSKTVRRVSLASLLLLLSSFGSCYVGDFQWQNEKQQFERYMEASGVYMDHYSIDKNIWHTIGFLLFFVSIAVGLAAYLLWEQDRNESR